MVEQWITEDGGNPVQCAKSVLIYVVQFNDHNMIMDHRSHLFSTHPSYPALFITKQWYLVDGNTVQKEADLSLMNEDRSISTAEVTDSPTGGVGGIPDLGTALKLVQQLLAVILKILLNAVQGAGGLVGGAAGAT
ncbi:hypothetical protein RB195_011989 [Necator americanus]|uniref:VASt domain-containing protein n=1 Tax=Necator americanus TaxID=51031 RepID=A0ABR1D4Y5_NECAM